MRFHHRSPRALLWGVLFAAAASAGLARAQEPARPAAANGTVHLVIDYGDGVQKHFTALEWHAGMTVLDALESAQRHPRGIKFAYRGQAVTAFLTRIDDLENQGRGRNWIFHVNDVAADSSFATFALKAGDMVLWKFSAAR